MAYVITITDGNGNKITVEVSYEVYEFDKECYWKEKWQERRRKYEDSIEEIYLHNKNACNYQTLPEKLILSSPEEFYLPKEELHNAINKLPEKQRRRFILYYLNGLTFEEIATAENISQQVAEKSTQKALSNLNKIIGNVEL